MHCIHDQVAPQLDEWIKASGKLSATHHDNGNPSKSRCHHLQGRSCFSSANQFNLMGKLGPWIINYVTMKWSNEVGTFQGCKGSVAWHNLFNLSKLWRTITEGKAAKSHWSRLRKNWSQKWTPPFSFKRAWQKKSQELDRLWGKYDLLSTWASVCLQLIAYQPSTRLMPPPEVKSEWADTK